MTFSDRARKIKALILDVDGVMTDGRLGYLPDGGVIKFFDVRDGHAIKMAQRHGFKVGILSGRDDAASTVRAKDLGLDFAITGQLRKLAGLTQLLAELQLTAEQCCFIGDDVVDMPVLRRVGLAVAVADCEPAIIPHCHWQTTHGGGRGAVREVVFRLLQEQGLWGEAMARYEEE